MDLNISVIYGSVRHHRQGIRAARYVVAKCRERFTTVSFIDPLEYDLPHAGSFGGVRAAMQLRAMLAEMGMSSIPSVMPIPSVSDAFNMDGTPKDEGYDKRIKRLLDEFEWYARALKEARKNGTPY